MAKKVAPKGPMADVTFKTMKGEKTIQAPVGSPMAAAASKAGAKIQYNCKNGECGTCEVLLDGKKVIRTCQFKVPKAGCKIMTKN
jgi:ferredoxin